jgi:hypothetical protein
VPVVEDMRVFGSGTSQNNANHPEQLGRAGSTIFTIIAVDPMLDTARPRLSAESN